MLPRLALELAGHKASEQDMEYTGSVRSRGSLAYGVSALGSSVALIGEDDGSKSHSTSMFQRLHIQFQSR